MIGWSDNASSNCFVARRVEDNTLAVSKGLPSSPSAELGKSPWVFGPCSLVFQIPFRFKLVKTLEREVSEMKVGKRGSKADT